MKKIICLSFAFLCFTCFTNAQSKYNNNIVHDKKGNMLKTLHNKKQDLLNLKSLAWRWDTIYGYDTLEVLRKRHTQTLDITNNVLIQLIEQWQNNAWANYKRHTYTFDENENILSDLYELWQSGAWVNSYRYTYTYDAIGNKLTQLHEQWQSGALLNTLTYRYAYTYDAYGNKLTELYEEWQSGAWVISDRHTYTYDAYGKMLSELNENWSTNDWVNWYRYTYTYDANGNMLTKLSEQWHTNAWVNDEKHTYTYDANGYLLTISIQVWNGASWQSGYISDAFTYDARGNVLTNTHDYLYGSFTRKTYTYDANGNMLSYEFEYTSNNVWRKYQKYTYTYDAYGNSFTGKLEAPLGGNWRPSMMGANLQIFPQNNSIYYSISEIYRYEASFRSFNTQIINDIAANNRLVVFPNPATNNITIKYPTLSKNKESIISIYNMQGQLLLQQPMQQEKQDIDISTLAKGIYLLKLSDSNNTEITKIVKE